MLHPDLDQTGVACDCAAPSKGSSLLVSSANGAERVAEQEFPRHD